jgi:hypothetical protein
MLSIFNITSKNVPVDFNGFAILRVIIEGLSQTLGFYKKAYLAFIHKLMFECMRL